MSEEYTKIEGHDDKLLPCPFCGYEAELWEYNYPSSVAMKVVFCSNTGEDDGELSDESCPLNEPTPALRDIQKEKLLICGIKDMTDFKVGDRVYFFFLDQAESGIVKHKAFSSVTVELFGMPEIGNVVVSTVILNKDDCHSSIDSLCESLLREFKESEMLNKINNVNGLNVFPSSHLPEFVQVPKKKHKLGRNGYSYHKRIQKKWNKRFGFSWERQILQTEAGIFAHPNTVDLIKNKIKEREE